MPTTDDQNEEDIDDATAGSATGMPHQAQASIAQQQTYVPWSSFESANRDVSQREAKKLQGKVQGDVDKARAELGDAQEGFDTGLDSNYSLGGKQKPSGTPAAPMEPGFGQLEAPIASQTQASPGGGAEKVQQQSRQPASAAPTDTFNPWESFLGGRPGAVQPGFSPISSAPQKGTPAPGGMPGGFSEIASTPAAPAQAPASLGGDIFGASRGSGARGHADALGAAAAPTNGLAQVDMDPLRLGGVAAGGKPAGAKDLEHSMSPEAWSQLLGDTLRAQNEAHALGSEAGVESLLQRQATSPVGNTAFDAALINGAGQKDFASLARDFGGDQLMKGVVGAQKDSQERWKQLQGDVAARQAMDRGPKPIPEDERPFVPEAKGEAPPAQPPIVIPAAPGVHPEEGAGLDEATYNQGKQAAAVQGGQVVISNRSDDPGPGWNRGAFGAEKPTINVWGKTKAEQASNWWGGADGPYPGDESIDAATWYALALLTTEQRAQWWAQNHP